MKNDLNHVLIVDDETAVRISLSAYLEDRDFFTFSAASGEEALNILEKENNIEVCTIDLRLPGIDGNSLIVKISELYPHIKFIIYTGSTNYALPGYLKNIGVKPEHVFLKPLKDMSVLVDSIETLISERSEK